MGADPHIDLKAFIREVNDVLVASQAFGGTAGQPDYHPDADVNRDGATTAGVDILWVAGQFGHTCAPPQHYTNS